MHSSEPIITAPMLLALILVSACGGDESATAVDSPVASPGASALTAERLRNATYEEILKSAVTLTDGRFEGEPFVAGAASRPVVTLAPDIIAGGDLDGDETEEAIVVLAHNSGGSGVSMYLAIMRDDHGTPDNIATVSLGDRVRVSAIAIDDGRIIADLVEHAPNDPMCCPSRQVRREWLFRGGQLVHSGPESGSEDGRFRGQLVWGHESRSFTSCDDGREGWVINDSGDELVEVYDELTSAPYQPMFVEVRGEWIEAPDEGFGADFEESLRITELLRAENEGFGCRLDLEDVLFVASGNEPFWRLQVREDGVSMRLMDAPGEIEFPAPRLSGQTPHIVFEAEGAGSGISISLERRRCVDTMSGARYAWVANVETAGRQFRGCAAEGIQTMLGRSTAASMR